MADKRLSRSRLEALMSMASSAVAEPAAGIAGLYGLTQGGTREGVRMIDKVRDKLTYAPRDPRGQQEVGQMLGPLAKLLEKGRNTMGDAAYGATGSPMAAAAAYTAPDALLSALGYRPAVAGATRAAGAVRSGMETATSGPTMGGALAQDGMVAYHGTPHRFAPAVDERRIPLADLDLHPEGVSIARAKWLWEPEYKHKNTNPIAVESRDGKLHVKDGYHRIHQARLNGETDIAARVTNPLGAFDMSKLGTGEGAQAYGHGLYFADSKGVASSYRKEPGLQDDDRWLVGGKKPHTPLGHAAVLVAQKGKDAALAELQAAYDAAAPWHKTPSPYMQQVQQQLDAVQNGLAPAIEKKSNLYTVDIPDEAAARFLDWDKPLSEQPEGVQRLAMTNSKHLLKELNVYNGNPHNQKSANETIWDGLDGDTLHQVLKRVHGKEAAAAMFREAGIPGIRYLDGGSRGAGKGSHNYVVFDDKLPKIIGRE